MATANSLLEGLEVGRLSVTCVGSQVEGETKSTEEEATMRDEL